MLAKPLRALGVREGDVVAITQKIVSKAEGRVVPDEGGGRSAWVERETRRVVARRGELIIAETRHGFVCANAGVDASNVQTGFVSLLPLDPDGSTEAIRAALSALLGLSRLGVVMTDTFGRPWRNGLVNVAIGCAGLPALVDLRGEPDHHGRQLEVTVVAVADEVAAASGLVMGKSARVPAALVRGIDIGAAPPGRGADLVRSPRRGSLPRGHDGGLRHAAQMRGLSVSLRTRETTRGIDVTGSNQGDPGRRPTKAERREEARLKREEIQRSMARRRRNRTMGLGLVVVAVAIAVVAVFLTSGGGEANASGIPSAATVLSQAPAAKTSAGCDAVQETPNYANAPGADPAIDHEHIGSSADLTSPPKLSTYPTTPPASGPHDPSPLPAGTTARRRTSTGRSTRSSTAP